MAQFIIAYNPRNMTAGRISGDWELLEAEDKYDALDKVLNMPVSGFPTSSILDQSQYIYILKVNPEGESRKM